MSKPFFRPYIRYNEANTPIFKGHMRLYYLIYKRIKFLPKTKKFMMYKFRKRLRNRIVNEY